MCEEGTRTGRRCGNGRLEGVDWREIVRGIEGGVGMHVRASTIDFLTLFLHAGGIERDVDFFPLIDH